MPKPSSQRWPFVMALLIGGALAILAGLSWRRTLQAADGIRIQRDTAIVAAGFKLEIQRQLWARVQMLSEMAKNESALKHPELLGIGLVDSGQPRWIFMLSPRTGLSKDLSAAEYRSVVDLARERRRAVMRLLETPQGAVMIACVPAGPNGETGRLAIGVIDVTRFLRTLLENAAREYAVVVYDGPTPIFARGIEALQGGWAQQAEIRLAGATWRIEVRPRQELLAQTVGKIEF